MKANNPASWKSHPSVDRIAKQFVWAICGQGIATISGLLMLRIYTTALPPNVYGEIALAMLSVTLSQQLLFGPLAQGISRFYTSVSGVETAKTLLQIVQKWLIVCCFLAVLPVIATRFISQASHTDGAVATLSLTYLLAVLQGIAHLCDTTLIAGQHRKSLTAFTATSSILKLCIAGVVLSFWRLASAKWALFALVISQAMSVGGQLVWLGRMWRKYSTEQEVAPFVDPMHETKLTHQFKAFVMPFVAWAPLTWISATIDRYTIVLSHGNADLGLYQILYQIGYYPLVAITNLATQVFGPVLYSAADNGQTPGGLSAKSMNERFLIIILGFAVSIAGAVHLGRDVISSYLVPPAYHGYASLLGLMALNAGIFAVGQQYGYSALIDYDSRYLARTKYLSAALGIPSTVLLGMIFGVAGLVGAGCLIGIANIFMFWRLRRG